MTRFPLRLRRALAALALTLGLSLGLSIGLPLATAPARAADVALPPVDQVFVLSARATAPDRIEVQWTIADGYYLYRHRTAVTADPGFGQTRLLLPEGAKHHDEFFGDVQTYRRRLVAVLEGHPTPGTRSATLTVKYQGCADAGVCYPPQTRTLQAEHEGGRGRAGVAACQRQREFDLVEIHRHVAEVLVAVGARGRQPARGRQRHA